MNNWKLFLYYKIADRIQIEKFHKLFLTITWLCGMHYYSYRKKRKHLLQGCVFYFFRFRDLNQNNGDVQKKLYNNFIIVIM